MAKVNIELPTGVESAEQLQKLLDTFVKQRVTSKARDKAVQQATKELKNKYGTEFKALVEKYSKVK